MILPASSELSHWAGNALPLVLSAFSYKNAVLRNNEKTDWILMKLSDDTTMSETTQ